MSKDDKKEEDQVQKGVAQEPGEEVVIENFRRRITGKTVMAIEGSVKFDDLAIRCDDAYVAADPENHKSNIQWGGSGVKPKQYTLQWWLAMVWSIYGTAAKG